MELEKITEHTWVLRDWERIPVYVTGSGKCILLDCGMYNQAEEIDRVLRSEGLTPIGILCSHEHVDHTGAVPWFKEKYGLPVALTLGEAGQAISPLGRHLQFHNLDPDTIDLYPDIASTVFLPDRIILPQEDEIDFCSVRFGIVRTPGHTCDHICIRTPDDVLYLGDAMMTGDTLEHAKFPYAFHVRSYLNSIRLLKNEKADWYIAAHCGVYREIASLCDRELEFFDKRMEVLLDLCGEKTTPKTLTAAICDAFEIHTDGLRNLAYFEMSSQAYLHYLCSLGKMKAVAEDDRIVYVRA